MDWLFYAFLATVVVHIVATPILVADVAGSFPDFHKSLGGHGVLFKPFKQLDLIWWILTRQYSKTSKNGFHRYDLYLANLLLFAILGISLAVSS
jgi:hypothetical protein